MININTLPFITMFLVWIVTVIAMPSLIRLIAKKKWVDRPNHRTSHTQITPSSGGLIFMIGILAAQLLFYKHTDTMILSIVAVALAVMGFIDDQKDLRATIRLFFQFIFAAILYTFDLRITSLYGILGVHEIPSYIALPFNLIIYVGVINAYNLIDGINGLSSGLSTISYLVFGSFFLLMQDFAFATLSLALAGSTLGFMKYNFHRASIFMGDTGSLVLGVTMAAFFFRLTQQSTGSLLPIGFSAILLPCIDMVRVFFTRIYDRRSPFDADRTHIHHQLLNLGDSHRTASLHVYLMHLAMILMAGTMQLLAINNHYTTAILITTALLGYGIIDYRVLMLLRSQQVILTKELSLAKDHNSLI